MYKKIKFRITLSSLLISLIIPAAYLGLLHPFYKYEFIELIFNLATLFPIVFFFSIITYFSRESVFKTWWKFTRVALPIVLIISFIISLELHHNPGSWFNTDNEADIVRLAITYLAFIIGSIVAMFVGYRKPS